MKKQEKNFISELHDDELGGTKIYGIVALVVVAMVIHAGVNYLPAVYQCESFKSEMHSATMRVLAMPHGQESLADKLKKQIRAAGNDNGVPPNATIEVTEGGNSLKARVKFIREVNILPFGLYKYQMQFDNTATA
jgi:hypothetical protein